MRFVPSPDLPDEVRDATDDEMRRTAEEVAAAVEARTPVDDGDARDSIVVGKDKHGWHVRAGGRRAPHFVFLEYGTEDTPMFAPLRRGAESVGRLERRRPDE